MKPQVTVIIPVLNQERFIGKAIDSALGQSYKSISVFVVDDGSTDATSDILKSYGKSIKVIRQENAGTSVAWNTAIKATQTKYLVGLDSDDELMPTTVSEVVRKAEMEPQATIIYSDYEFIDKDGTSLKQVHNPDPYNPVKQLIYLHDHLGRPENFLPFGHVRLYHLQDLIDIGGYDPTYLYAEDFDLVLRLAENGASFAHVPKLLYRYRWHDRNKGVITRKEQIEEVRRSVCEFRKRQTNC